MKCERCSCDECSEYGAVLYEGQRLLFCNEAVISCYDLEYSEVFMDMTHAYEFPEKAETFDMQPVPGAVPYALRHLVCMCSEDTQMNKEPSIIYPASNKDGKLNLLRLPGNIYSPVCRNCFKYFRWVMRTCVICKDQFTATFRHPYFCSVRPACWNCLEERTAPMCNGGPGHFDCPKLQKPRWINEKDLTRQVKPDLSKMELPEFDW